MICIKCRIYVNFSYISGEKLFLKKTSILKKENFKFVNSKLSKIFFSPDQLKMELVKRQIKTSEFKNQLKERKKLSILYGNLSKKQIKKLYFQANEYQGEKKANWLRLLESRLDVVLFRICFFKNKLIL